MERENAVVKILSKEYQISCPKGAELELQSAVNYLDEKMSEIRNNGRVMSFEGMLVTAAINLANETIKQNLETKNLIKNLHLLEEKLTIAIQKTSSRNKIEFEYNNN
jgi:cell division protein ZapA (FtsZ GTPase activity inhibitor)